MGFPHNESIEQVCGEFRSAWLDGQRPRISEYLQQATHSDHPALLSALIEADVAQRRRIGESPRPDDYLQLGRDAVTVASKLVNEPGSSLDLGLEHTTAFESVEALGDVSENLSVDLVNTQSGSDSIASNGQDAEVSKYIGRYKLIQEIGVGGMGSVWLAEQQEPVKRRVALKVIRADLGCKSAIARFEAERQAIALMDHQNIAKILDAGTTENGNPYFVMELVNGIPLNRYCDKKKLTVRQRLELMIPVCRAVQHAHQKGIIHRDLKHSNVLVTEYDGEPVPKVIDFGLAKALGHQDTLTDKTMFTEFGKVVGTLQYMSPEQAETNNLDVDTRADVYSLGVMIYKLLTGVTPLEQNRDSQISLIGTLKIIREIDPSRPSIRLRDDDDESISELCALRQVQPGKLRQILEGDLDWIVMKALEKDRRERYETANALAMELERFLNDEKVLARPHSALYGMKKVVKRNQLLVASLLGFAILLAGGIIATGSASIWALHEKEIASQHAVDAENERDRAKIAEGEALARKQEALDQKSLREIELYAMKLKSAWHLWQRGKTEPAWRLLNEVAEFGDGWERKFLRSEFTAKEKILYGHARDVNTIALSNDGSYIASSGHDNTLRLWNTVTHELVFRKILEEEGVCVCFSPDSSLVACADRSNVITICSTKSSDVINTIGPFESEVLSLAFLNDNQRLLAGTASRDSFRIRSDRHYQETSPPKILLLTLNGEVLQSMNGHTDDITGIYIGHSGKVFVSGSLDRSIIVWELVDDQFEPKHTLLKHFLGVTGVAVSPSEKQIASSSKDGTIRLWDTATGELTRTIAGHTDFVNSVNYSKDGMRLVSTSADRTARIWNLDGDELFICQGHYSAVNDAVFSNSGENVLTASRDNTIRIWNSKTKSSTIAAKGHSDTVWTAADSPDGHLIASGSEDGTVTFMDTASGKLIGQKLQHETAVLSVAFSPDGRWLAVGCADHLLRIWRMEDRKLEKTIDAHKNYIWYVSFSKDGKFLATGSADASAKIWRTSDWGFIHEFTGHTGEIASVRFSNDGKFLVTASDDNTVKLWNTTTFEMIRSFDEHTNTVWKALFSPDGKLIASSSYDGRIIVWNASDGKIIHDLQRHTNQVAGLAYSKDGTRLASGSDDGTLKIWDTGSGVELFELLDQDDEEIVHVSFSRDGSKLISGTSEGWVTIRSVLDQRLNREPFLPQNSEALSIKGLPIVVSRLSSIEELVEQRGIAQKCTDHFPTFKSYINLGLAQYRLGQYREAIHSLEEASRLESIQYGEPDLRPNIEAFLIMAYQKTGQFSKAQQVKKVFDMKRAQPLWVSDLPVSELVAEVEEALALEPE